MINQARLSRQIILTICKAIIEAHSGRIWVESVKVVSSTFYFLLSKAQRD